VKAARLATLHPSATLLQLRRMFARTQAVSGARSLRLAVISPFGSRVGPTPKCASGMDVTPPARCAPKGPYAALDLGTNNCRLLIARPTVDGFRVIDSFSRIVRLGEGLSQTGRLSEAAIARTISALTVCRDKMRTHGVARARMIATEACRSAANGIQFLEEVRDCLGIQLEIVDRETEAHLAAAGCGALADQNARSIVLFDIGGGSSEIVWLSGEKREGANGSDVSPAQRIQAWESLRLGVVTLAEKFGGHDVSDHIFAEMTNFVADQLAPFAVRVAGEARCAHFHLLGTSGTVTTIAGVHLNLPRYDRRQIDGLWLTSSEVDATVRRLRSMTYAQRSANPCIGYERADLVLAGCAILEAIRQSFPAERIRIADRGLREGILTQLISADRSGPPVVRMGH
jgi:exopolyphosphatase / guanosine-5'-triphosphate,3'-diphosphate pyrophosphatase